MSAASDPGPPHRGAFEKVSVTIPGTVMGEARERAGQGGLSAYVTAAVERALERDRLRDLLVDLDALHGPVPEKLIAQAAATWPEE